MKPRRQRYQRTLFLAVTAPDTRTESEKKPALMTRSAM